MDTFSLVRSALDKSADDEINALLNPKAVEIARVTLAVQSVVDALTPADGGRYIVGFTGISTAATDLAGRRIIISSKPLHDPTLSLIEKAVVVATFAAHEIGHTVITRPRSRLTREHNVHKGYHSVANLADDIILEPWMVDRYPILRDAFEFTGLWVLRNGDAERREAGVWKSTAARFNTLLHATRFGDIPEIVWVTQRARDERDWARAWADRLIDLRLDDHTGFLALCDEAWIRIRLREDDIVEDPIIDEPEPGEDVEDDEPEDDEDEESEESEDEEIETEPTEDESDEDEPKGKGKGNDESETEDEDEAEDDESDDESEDESEPGGDEPTGKGEDEGGSERDPNDDHGDWDDEPEGSDDEGLDGPTKSGSPDGRDGGGGDADKTAEDMRDEDDFDPTEVDESTHEQSEATGDYEAASDEQAVRTYTSSTKIAFGKHGTALVTWD